MPRFCTNCGYQVEADSVFCDTCGFDLTQRNNFNQNSKTSPPDKTVLRINYPLNYDYYRRSPPKFTKNLVLGITLSVIFLLTGVLIIPFLMNQDSYNPNSNTAQPAIIGEKYYEIDEDPSFFSIFLNISIPHGSVHIYIATSEILFGSYIEIIGFPQQSAEDASNFYEIREENTSYLYLTPTDSFEYNVWISISSLTNVSINTLVKEGDIFLSAYESTIISLFTYTIQGETGIEIFDSLITSSDYFSKYSCYVGIGDLFIVHHNLTYESNDFYWELESDSGLIDLYILQESLTNESLVVYDIESSQGDILLHTYIKKDIGVDISAIASDLIYINHPEYGYFESLESFIFSSENYGTSLMQMNFFIMSQNGILSLLEID